MSEKRRNKPIQIALTEEQIANIIQEAAGSRRDLNVESLEDRIAPSRFGLPVLGGAEGLVDQPDAPEGPQVGADGTTISDPIPHAPGTDAPFDPTAGGDPTDPGGDIPYDPNNPAPFDPNNVGDGPDAPFDPSAGDPFNAGNPNPFVPGGEDGAEALFGDPTGEDVLFGGQPNELGMPEGTPDELQWLWSQDANAWADAIPDDVDPAVRDEVLGQLAEMNDHIQETIANTGEMPPVDELNDHRMAILRNLRDA